MLSKNNVPWGEVKTFADFLKTKTAKNFLTNGLTQTKTIRVPKCAITVARKNAKVKATIPELGQDTDKILKSLGYSKESISILKKKKVT
jgi:crotonobetainyl-CoA:carnitine CoA-transferase CaiB-like acyl-CoA transferase